jgi:uroporphyrinogen-III synthase
LTDKTPLQGRKIVVTRPEEQAGTMVDSLRNLGATPILFPVIRIEAHPTVKGLEQALRRLDHYNWLIFTSVNGVDIFWQWLERLEIAADALTDLEIATIGPATAAALRERGLTPAFVPDRYVGEALAEGMPDVDGRRCLLPRASGSRPALPRLLEQRGAVVDEFHLYRAVEAEPTPEALQELHAGVDIVTFTSPSTVRHFAAALEGTGLNPLDLPGSPVVACIGLITAAAAEREGYAAGVVAGIHTIDGLVQALTDFYKKREPT